MTSYNPFSKPLNSVLEIDDLEELINNSVSEGYYIEYKSEFVSNKKIERSIASFANTYGGWYFIGIEGEKTNNRALNICGFSKDLFHDPIAKVRDIARVNLSHMPLMFPQVIDIDDDKSVLAIYIPEGIETPYITSDGRIYRRAADSSDPIYEKDRYSLDRLVDRGNKEQELFDQFCSDERTRSQAESEIPWLSIYFQPQPRKQFFVKDISSRETIQTLLDLSRNKYTIIRSLDDVTSSVPLNYGHTSGSSIILRQVNSLKPYNNSVTMQIFSDGRTKIHIPFITIDLESKRFKTKKLRDYLNHLDSETLTYIKGIDLGNSLLACMNLIALYCQWLSMNNWQDEMSLWGRLSIENAWRILPLVDSEHWVNFVVNNGLPISLIDDIDMPHISDDALRLDSKEIQDLSVSFAGRVCTCLGIPYDLLGNMLTDILQQ